MSNTNIEVKGKIKKMFRGCPKSNGWFGCFFHVNNQKTDISLIGMTSLPLVDGMELKIKAHPEMNNGRVQYVADDIEMITNTRNAIVKYLSGPGFSGIGTVTAEKIYREFGKDTLDIIVNEPDKLKQFGFSDSRIQIIQSTVLCDTMSNQLRKWIPTLTKKQLATIELVLGSDAVSIIQNNPYRLMDCGFKFEQADNVASVIGFPMDSDVRIRACVFYNTKKMLENGDVYLNLSNDLICGDLLNRTVCMLHHPNVSVNRVMAEIQMTPQLYVDFYRNEYHLYCRDLYQSELDCVDAMVSLLQSKPLYDVSKRVVYDLIKQYEKTYGIYLDDIQKSAVYVSITNRVSIITGGPGCGKTTVIQCLLFVWSAVCGRANKTKRHVRNFPLLTTPTGKSLRRLCEAVDMEFIDAHTVAYRICHDYKQELAHESTNGVRGSLGHYDSNLLVLDESSMVGLSDMARLLQLAKNCQIVFVGDVNQLPSISHGSFFLDICTMPNMPMTNLVNCYRVKGQVILDNAKKICNGVTTNSLTFDGKTFTLYPQLKDDNSYVDSLINIYQYHLQQGLDLKDICILCPMRSYLTGVSNLNLVLQNIQNPETTASPIKSHNNMEHVYTNRGFAIPDTFYAGINKQFTRLRVGDRVMQTVNRYGQAYLVSDKYGTGIFNGDCGVIESYHVPLCANNEDKSNAYMVVVMDDGRRYEIDDTYFDELELAYAMTIHKSQGSEYEVVIISAQCQLQYFPNEFDFASRNLFYTGVTRAKSCVEIVGSYGSVDRCIKTLPRLRNSMLIFKVLDSLSFHNVNED